VWPRTEQLAQEKTWPALVAAHKKPGFPGGKKETLAHRSDGPRPAQTKRLQRLSSSMLPAGKKWADLSKPCEGCLTAVSGCRPGHPPIFSLIVDESDDHPSLVAPVSRWVAGPSATRRPSTGGTKSAIRAQAVPPTATAPITAKATRQASDGMPIWAKPSVPL
jgi:hypothetical protein